MVGLAVFAYYTGPVGDYGDGQVLKANVVHHLVEGPLQEGGVDGDEGLCTGGRHASSHADGVLLGNAHVVHPVGKLLADFLQAGAFQHSAEIPTTEGSCLMSRFIVFANTLE